MKPEPYHAPPPRELSEEETSLLRCSAAFGDAPVKIRGTSYFAMARRIAKMGLGTLEGRDFRANARGIAAVAKRPGA